MSLDYLDKIRKIVKDAVASRKLDYTVESRGENNDRSRRLYYYCDWETLDAIADNINDDLLKAGLAPEWVAEFGPLARKRPELGYYIEVTTHDRDGCPELVADTVYFKLRVVKKAKATKKLTQSGDSLVINVTKEVKPLGLQRGDYVNVTIEPAEDHD